MKQWPLRKLLGLALSALGLLAAGGCATAREAGPATFTVAREPFTSGGEEIAVDVYTPKASGPHRPVVVLHGAGGMLFDGPEMTRMARALADAGFEAYQVHYFNRTHTFFARQAVLLKLFSTWQGTIHDAIEWVRARRPEAGPVGMYGYSLGAFASVEEARRNPHLGAVVEQAGGFWHAHPEGPTRLPLPPMLLVHGLDDQRVPFAKYAEPLLAYLRKHDQKFEKSFYPGEGHQFGAAANAKVRAEAVEFFARHLR